MMTTLRRSSDVLCERNSNDTLKHLLIIRQTSTDWVRGTGIILKQFSRDGGGAIYLTGPWTG